MKATFDIVNIDVNDIVTDASIQKCSKVGQTNDCDIDGM